MDAPSRWSFEIITTIWAFVTPIVGIVKVVYHYITKYCCYDSVTTTTYIGETGGIGIHSENGTGIVTLRTNDCSIYFPFHVLNIINASMSEWDDAVLSVAIIDFSFFTETINREELDGTDNILETFKVLFQVSKRYDKIITLVRIIKGVIGRLAIPILIRSYKEGLDDEAVMTRALTFGAPILQEFGINFLTLLLYGVMILMLSFQISRTIAKYTYRFILLFYLFWGLGIACLCYIYISKLEDKIEKVFLIAIITIRTFGPVRLNCGGLDIGSAICSGINLWFAAQNMIWAIKGSFTILNS